MWGGSCRSSRGSRRSHCSRGIHCPHAARRKPHPQLDQNTQELMQTGFDNLPCESTFDSLLVSTLLQQFGGIPIQRVALVATRQVIHRSIPQQPEIIGVIGNSAEPGKKSRDRVDWLATTPAGRMRELVRLAQATPQKSNTFSTGVRLLLERGMRCGSAFSNTETNPLACSQPQKCRRSRMRADALVSEIDRH